MECNDLRGENAWFGKNGHHPFVGEERVLEGTAVEHGEADEGAGKFGGAVGNRGPEFIKEVCVVGAGAAAGAVVGGVVTPMVSTHGDGEGAGRSRDNSLIAHFW